MHGQGDRQIESEETFLLKKLPTITCYAQFNFRHIILCLVRDITALDPTMQKVGSRGLGDCCQVRGHRILFFYEDSPQSGGVLILLYLTYCLPFMVDCK